MYGDPLIFLNGLVSMNDLYEGMIHFIDERNEKELFQVWLHKSFDGASFSDWKRQADAEAKKQQGMNKQERDFNVMKSQNILNNFVPPD